MIRATRYLKHGEAAAEPAGTLVLAHDERHLRRKLLTLGEGDEVLVDLPEPVMLGDGDMLVLEDGRAVRIAAAEEELYWIAGRDALHLAELAWHLGNRHLAAQIETDRILIRRDHVIRVMLEGLGAVVRETIEPFQPVRGAYHGHGHEHAHEDGHAHAHHHHHHG